MCNQGEQSLWSDGDGGCSVPQDGWIGRALPAEMRRLSQRYGRKILVLCTKDTRRGLPVVNHETERDRRLLGPRYPEADGEAHRGTDRGHDVAARQTLSK